MKMIGYILMAIAALHMIQLVSASPAPTNVQALAGLEWVKVSWNGSTNESIDTLNVSTLTAENITAQYLILESMMSDLNMNGYSIFNANYVNQTITNVSILQVDTIVLPAEDHYYLTYEGFPDTGWYAGITALKQSLSAAGNHIINFTLGGDIELAGVIKQGESVDENEFGGDIRVVNDNSVKADLFNADDANFVTWGVRLLATAAGSTFGSSYDPECTFKGSDWCFMGGGRQTLLNKLAVWQLGNETHQVGRIFLQHLNLSGYMCLGGECRNSWEGSEPHISYWTETEEAFAVTAAPINNFNQMADNQVNGRAGIPILQNGTLISLGVSDYTLGDCSLNSVCFVSIWENDNTFTNYHTTNLTIGAGNKTSMNSAGYADFYQSPWQPLQLERGQSITMSCLSRTCSTPPAEIIYQAQILYNSSTVEGVGI